MTSCLAKTPPICHKMDVEYMACLCISTCVLLKFMDTKDQHDYVILFGTKFVFTSGAFIYIYILYIYYIIYIYIYIYIYI